MALGCMLATGAFMVAYSLLCICFVLGALGVFTLIALSLGVLVFGLFPATAGVATACVLAFLAVFPFTIVCIGTGILLSIAAALIAVVGARLCTAAPAPAGVVAGSSLVAVPPCTGLPLFAATPLLAAVGLQLGQTHGFSAATPLTTSQIPAAGSMVAPGTSVDLTAVPQAVSPGGGGGGSASPVAVPVCIGSTLAGATALLNQVGLQVGAAIRFSSAVTVTTSQSPLPTALVPAGSSVDLVGNFV